MVYKPFNVQRAKFSPLRKQKSVVLVGRFLAVNFCTMGHSFFNLSRWSGVHRGDQRLPDHSPRGTLEYVSLSDMSLKEWPRLLQCCATRRTWINGKRKANERVPRNIGATGQPFLNWFLRVGCTVSFSYRFEKLNSMQMGTCVCNLL